MHHDRLRGVRGLHAVCPVWLLGRYVLGLDGASDRAAVHEALRARVTDLMPERFDGLPLLGTVFDVEFDETPETAGLDPEFRRQWTDEITATFLQRALEGPVVLAFEDVHYMDEASQGLVRRLADRPRRRPHAVVPHPSRDRGPAHLGSRSACAFAPTRCR